MHIWDKYDGITAMFYTVNSHNVYNSS